MEPTPERLSVAERQTWAGRVVIQVEVDEQPGPEAITVVGGVRSTLTGVLTVPVPVLPALSVADPVGLWPAPSPRTVLADTEATPEVASVADQATVTVWSYQPAALGAVV